MKVLENDPKEHFDSIPQHNTIQYNTIQYKRFRHFPPKLTQTYPNFIPVPG